MRSSIRAISAAAVFIFLPMPGPQGVRAQSAPQWKPARTPDGQPDIQGYWDGTAGIGAAYDLENGTPPAEHVITGGNQNPSQSQSMPHVIVDPSDGKIPYEPWAAAIRDENRKNSLHPVKLEQIDSLSRCLQMGAPRMHFLGGFLALQRPNYVVVLYSPNGGGSGSSRTIALDGRPHIGANIKLWAGDSVGHWEGNVLVVDVTNINEHGWYDWAGNFHSDELHLVERWTIVDADTIDYEVTSYDPKVFTKPWTLKNEFKRNKKTDREMFEDACYEGEKDVEIMLHQNEEGGDGK
jgi:hypothetical protein